MSAPIGERPILNHEFLPIEYYPLEVTPSKTYVDINMESIGSNTTTITLGTYILVPESYMSDVVWNLAGVLPSWIPNILILIIGCFGSIQGRFKHSIIGMTASQFYATIGQTILYFGYIYLRLAEIPITVLACSIPRRILQQTITPALMSTLVISIDRYLSIIWGYSLSKFKLFLIFLIPFIYAHLIYNSLTLLPGVIGTSDMCGPCLSMPKAYSAFLEPIIPLCLIIAIGFNIRILIFLHNYHKGKRALQSYSARELKELKSAMIGVMLQACIPMLFSMPQVINLAMYNINAAIRLPKSFWVVINFLNYFTLFLNPLVTMLFVKQFRIAVIKFFTNGKMITTTSVHEVTPPGRLRGSITQVVHTFALPA